MNQIIATSCAAIMKCPSFCPLIWILDRVCADGVSFQSEPWAKLELEDTVNEWNFILNSSFPLLFSEENKLHPGREGHCNIRNVFSSFPVNFNPDLAKWCSYINILSCTYAVDASEDYSPEIFQHSSALIVLYCSGVPAFPVAVTSTKPLNRPHTGSALGFFFLFFFPGNTLLLIVPVWCCCTISWDGVEWLLCAHSPPQLGHLVSRREDKG